MDGMTKTLEPLMEGKQFIRYDYLFRGHWVCVLQPFDFNRESDLDDWWIAMLRMNRQWPGCEDAWREEGLEFRIFPRTVTIQEMETWPERTCLWDLDRWPGAKRPFRIIQLDCNFPIFPPPSSTPHFIDRMPTLIIGSVLDILPSLAFREYEGPCVPASRPINIPKAQKERALSCSPRDYKGPYSSPASSPRSSVSPPGSSFSPRGHTIITYGSGGNLNITSPVLHRKRSTSTRRKPASSSFVKEVEVSE